MPRHRAERQGGATIIGTTRKTSPDLAAFANGAASRYYDLNDIYVGRRNRPPERPYRPVPCGRRSRTSRRGRDLITAIVLAYEIDCRLVDALDITRAAGTHPCSVFRRLRSLPAS